MILQDDTGSFVAARSNYFNDLGSVREIEITGLVEAIHKVLSITSILLCNQYFYFYDIFKHQYKYKYVFITVALCYLCFDTIQIQLQFLI